MHKLLVFFCNVTSAYISKQVIGVGSILQYFMILLACITITKDLCFFVVAPCSIYSAAGQPFYLAQYLRYLSLIILRNSGNEEICSVISCSVLCGRIIC